jgi:hypothetical protein
VQPLACRTNRRAAGESGVPLSARTAEPAGALELLPCPPDVEAHTILSFLTGRFGGPIETAWTSTGRHPLIDTGWIFRTPQALEDDRDVEIMCVALIEAADGPLRSLFEQLADGREDFDELASHDAFDQHTLSNCPSLITGPGGSGS